MANILSTEKQILCLKLLAEGNSIRATERITEVHRDTVMRLMVKFGQGCEKLLEESIQDVFCRHLEIDEQWTFCGKKQAQCNDEEKASGVLGDQYLFLALDQDTGLIPAHFLGKRNDQSTFAFFVKLIHRIALPADINGDHSKKPMFSTDGFPSYPNKIYEVFGELVQHGVIVKNYANEESGRYAAPDLSFCDRRRVQFVENLRDICTSHVERLNNTTRQHVKRFTRLTLAFSKKIENLKAAISMYVANHNFVWRSRENEGGRFKLPAAMQAGIVNTLWSFDDLFEAVM